MRCHLDNGQSSRKISKMAYVESRQNKTLISCPDGHSLWTQNPSEIIESSS